MYKNQIFLLFYGNFFIKKRNPIKKQTLPQSNVSDGHKIAFRLKTIAF